MIHPGESWRSKEEEVHVLTPRINRRCAVGPWLPMCTFQFAAQPQQADEHPEKVFRWQRGAWGNPPCQSTAAVLNLLLCHDWCIRMTAVNADLTFRPGLNPPALPQVSESSSYRLPFIFLFKKSISMKYIILSKYIVLILCLGGRRWFRVQEELKWLNNLWNECRFTDSHSSDTGEPKKHQKQPKALGYFTLYLFPVMPEKL